MERYFTKREAEFLKDKRIQLTSPIQGMKAGMVGWVWHIVPLKTDPAKYRLSVMFIPPIQARMITKAAYRKHARLFRYFGEPVKRRPGQIVTRWMTRKPNMISFRGELYRLNDKSDPESPRLIASY